MSSARCSADSKSIINDVFLERNEKCSLPCLQEWHAYDPYLISEGLFGAGMISSYLKIVQILSVNPHLGSLQISLGRMIMDIMKWIALAVLVCFAFGQFCISCFCNIVPGQT